VAKATAEPGERLDDAAERSQPPGVLSLDALSQFGAVYFGVEVRAVKLSLADGRVQRLELPTAELDDEPDHELTPKQSAILTVVDEMKVGEVLGYEAIASKAGYSASMDLRDFVRQLAMAGRLVKDRGGWKRVK